MIERIIYWGGKGPCKRTQHCWMLNVASFCTPCCVLLGVVASVCALLQTRTQHIPTSLDQQCWKLSCPLQIAKIWGRRRRQKRRLKREFAFFQSSSWFPQSLTLSNVGELSWSWISKNRNHVPAERERKFCRPLFAFSTKREIRHFYVVVERWRQRNHVQKNLDARPKLLFSLLKVFLFWRSRCRRRRRLLRSLFTPRRNYTLQHLSFSERRYICLLSNKRPVIIILGICSDWKASDVTTASVFFTISIF